MNKFWPSVSTMLVFLFTTISFAGTTTTAAKFPQCQTNSQYTKIHMKKSDGQVVDALVRCKDFQGLEKGSTVELW